MDSIRKQFPQIEEAAWPLLEAWAALLREWNTKINLISRKDIEYLEVRHLSHCLSITNHLKLMSGTRIMDVGTCLLYTSPSPRDLSTSRMPSSA